jgi:hypothetical protein
MPLGAIAAIGVVASAGVGAYDAYQQTGIQNDAQGMADTQFSEQQGYASLLNNLINDPANQTKALPGYEFNFNQGADAVAREMGASGFLGSGNEAIALTQYGQNYAMNTFNQYASLLASLSGLQTTSPNSNLLNTSTGANNAAFNQEGQLLASLGYMNKNNNNGGFTTADMYMGSQSGFGSPGTMDAGGGYTFSY